MGNAAFACGGLIVPIVLGIAIGIAGIDHPRGGPFMLFFCVFLGIIMGISIMATMWPTNAKGRRLARQNREFWRMRKRQ